MPPALVVSLDFELFWGVLDSKTIESYGDNIRGVQRALPAILDLLDEFQVKATIATVGFLFCDNTRQLREASPALRPTYDNPRLSPYAFSYDDGPLFFAPDLVSDLLKRSNHEIASHTFSHFYCREPGQTAEQFRADLLAARQVSEGRGAHLTSLVFPRNQVSIQHLEVCRQLGFTAFRGNQSSWVYRFSDRKKLGRLLRWLDSYVNLSGANCHPWPGRIHPAGLLNTPASAYLRPHCARAPWLDRWHRRRLARSMSQAARRGEVFHLWWHPHNFGRHLGPNLANLRAILEHYLRLKSQHAMGNFTMSELACGV